MPKAKPVFEAVELSSGDFGWRMRDGDGEIVSVKPGRIMGIEMANKRRSLQRAVQQVLANRIGVGTADNGR